MSKRLLVIDTSSNCLDMALRAKMARCPKCGGTERTKDNRCKACRANERVKYEVANPHIRKKISKNYYDKNASRVNAANKLWRERNPEKEASRQVRYARSNKDVICGITARRRSRKLSCTPAWANEFFIAEAYDIATKRSKVTGIEWHVDHIVPLQGKTVCGLHVEHNLRVVPAIVNLKKGNRYWPEMPT